MKKILNKQFFKKVTAAAVGVSLAAVQFTSVMVSSAYSAQMYTPTASVTFTFDDGLASTYKLALPVLNSKGIKGVLYHNTSYTGKSGYMSWSQIKELQNKYGWEIGSHSYSHPLMTTLSSSQLKKEVEKSKEDLVKNGINPVSFATPYGDYDNNVIAAIAKEFAIHRPFHDRQANNVYPYNNYLIYVQSVEKTTTIDQVKAWVDNAKATNTALVLVFHEIVSSKASDQYDVTESMLKQIADYAKSSNVKTTLIKDLIEKPDVNYFQNSSFDQNLTGWSTSGTGVKVDDNSNGSYPSSKKSVVISGNSAASHLMSPKVDVKSNNTYAIKAFTNQADFKTGEYGYYLNEYDSSGNWVSGRWIFGNFDNNTNNSDDVFQVSYLYMPTSDIVSSVMLEVYMNANSKGKVYVDNIEMYKVYSDNTVPATPVPTPEITSTPSPSPTQTPVATVSASPAPTETPIATMSASPVPSTTATPKPSATAKPTATPKPTSTPKPTATPVPGENLVRNSSFGAVDKVTGFALYWSNDDTSVVYDTNSRGCGGPESIVMNKNNTVNAHLFSTKDISVDSTKSYQFGSCVVVGEGTGEFGYYIDEYDANYVWLGGKWLGSAQAGKRTDTFDYTPSSEAVKNVRLQFYKSAGSTFDVSIDKVTFYVK